MYCISEYTVEILPVVYTGGQAEPWFYDGFIYKNRIVYVSHQKTKTYGKTVKTHQKILPCRWRLRRRGRRYREPLPERAGVVRSDQDIQTVLRRESQDGVTITTFLLHWTENTIYVFPEMKLRPAPFPIPTFLYLWAIYKFPGSGSAYLAAAK